MSGDGVGIPRGNLIPDVTRKFAERFSKMMPEFVRRSESSAFCIRVLLLLAVFLLVNRFVSSTGNLPVEAYRREFLTIEVAIARGPVVLVVMLLGGLFLLRYGALVVPWTNIQAGRELRWFIVFLCLMMTWPFAFYGYNYYLDQPHLLDRALLVVLAVLLIFRPIFIFPYVFLAFVLMWQLGEPSLGGSIFAHKLQVLHVLTLFAAFFLLHAFTAERRSDSFVFLTVCLVAAAYWEAALAKIEIGWIFNAEVFWVLLASYAHGWLAMLQPETVIKIAYLLKVLNWPMAAFVLVVESSFLFVMLNRGFSVALLIAAATFHLAVFALMGFLFWTWIALDLALVVLLLRDRSEGVLWARGKVAVLLSIPLIALGSYWAKPPHLGWFDTKLAYTYQFDAVGQSGVTYRLHPSFFAPFEDIFTMTTFSYLQPGHNFLVGPYGVTHSREIAEAVNRMTTAAEVFDQEEQIGIARYNPERRQRLFDFLTQFVDARNSRNRNWLDLRAPPQFWSLKLAEVPPVDDPIRILIVKEVTTFFDGQTLSPIREVEITRLAFPVQ